MKTVACTFAYVQPALVAGYRAQAMFHLGEPVEGHAKGSTVTAATLDRLGYEVPGKEATKAVAALAVATQEGPL